MQLFPSFLLFYGQRADQLYTVGERPFHTQQSKRRHAALHEGQHEGHATGTLLSNKTNLLAAVAPQQPHSTKCTTAIWEQEALQEPVVGVDGKLQRALVERLDEQGEDSLLSTTLPSRVSKLRRNYSRYGVWRLAIAQFPTASA